MAINPLIARNSGIAGSSDLLNIEFNLDFDFGTFGTNGNDTFYPVGPATIYGLGGDDIMIANNFGAVHFYGGSGNDFLRGSGNDDYLSGGTGNDTIYGSRGNDTIYGGDGADFIDGGAHNDHMWGGAGADTFVFSAHYGQDVIGDFQHGIDKIDLTGFGLNALPLIFNNAAGNAFIDFGNGDTLELTGVNANTLTAADFKL